MTDCNCICMQSFTELAFHVHSSRYYVGSMILYQISLVRGRPERKHDCCLSSLLTHERVAEKVLSLRSPPVHKCSSEHTCFWNRNKVFQPIRRQRQGPEPVTFQTGEGVGQGNCSCYSNCVSTCPTSSALAGRLMCLRLVCALFLNEDTTGRWWTSWAPDCCDTSSSPPLCPLCGKFLEVALNVIWCTIMMIDSFVNLIVLKYDITCELHYN